MPNRQEVNRPEPDDVKAEGPWILSDGSVDESRIGYALLSILQAYAPTGIAQQRCTELYHQAQRDEPSLHRQVVSMANALSDGLNYGNWPWVFEAKS